MQPAKILSELRRVLSPADAPFVLAALSEDDLIWNSLQQPEILDSILTEDSRLPSAWSPASLAFRPLGSRVSITELAAEHLPGIEVSLRKQSLELLDSTLRNAQPVSTLAQAGILALALRERRRKTRTWRGFLDELTAIPARSPSDLVAVWKTPLACLYGIIPDRWDLLEALLPQDAMHPAIDWISHMILTDPVEPVVQVKLFHDLMCQLVVEYQVEWLRYLIGKGRFALAAGIADQLLITGKDFLNSLETPFNPDHAEWVAVSRKVLDHQLTATLYQISGRPLQAGIHLDKTRHLLQHWLVGSTLQMAHVIDHEGIANKAVYEECADLMAQLPVSDKLKNEALFLGGSEMVSKRLQNLAPAFSSPMARIYQFDAKSALSDEGGSQAASREAVRDLLVQIENDPTILKGQFVFDWDPLDLLNSLVEKGLEIEAVELAELFLKVRSEDKELLGWLADTCHQLGLDAKSLDYQLRMVLLEPEKLDHLRRLSKLFEDRQEWAFALEERRKIVLQSLAPELDDQVALASCAISAQNYSEVYETCEKILVENPDHGMAYTLLGKASLAQGKLDAGIEHLAKAIALVPEVPAPWFELAEAYRQKGDTQKVLDTLREAVLTAPDSSELHYALGKAYLDNTQISDALPFLRQSARLAPESVEIAQALAEALITLGYKHEALDVVQKARTRWRVHPGLAYLHAKMLLKEGHSDEGLEILEIALQSEHPQAEWFVLSAQTLVGNTEDYLTGGDYTVNKIQLTRALTALQKTVALQPQNFQARLLTAEALLLRGDYEQAYDVYRNLIELPEAVQDEWYWRMQAGFGRSALALGQTETALASLQNAATANPDAIGLQHYLAEAYCAADLSESAADVAEQAHALAPEDAENLTWYAGIMSKVNQAEKAIDALKAALELKPGSVDLILKLAEIQLVRGDHESARADLTTVVENSAVTAAQLREAAHLYMRMEENLKALGAMEKAAYANTQADATLLFELAVLYKNSGKLEKSLKTIHQAISAHPEQAAYYVLQADLQEKSNHSQAALESLENALRLSVTQDVKTALTYPCEGYLKPFAMETTSTDIHILITQLHQKMGNLNEALNHAVKALEDRPDSTEIRFVGAELAAKLLLDDQVSNLLKPVSAAEGKTPQDNALVKKDPWLAGIYSLQAEAALDAGDNQAASRLISEGKQFDPDNLRLNAAKATLLARTGEWIEAGKLFSELWAEVTPALKVKTIRTVSDERRISVPDGTLMAVAETAVELYSWPEANQLLEHVLRMQPSQPLALLRQVKTMVRAAEWYFTASKLGSIVHLPDEYVTGEAAYTHFMHAVSELKKLSSSPEIERWKVRGEAVFHPSTSTIRGFTTRTLAAEDAASLVLALNRSGNADGAQQIGAQYSAHPMVSVQMALIEEGNDSSGSQNAGAKAVSLMPNHPVSHAALAYAAEKNGDIGRALEAVETALIFWPNESGWQYWAAQLAKKSNEIDSARAHLEKTHALMPANLEVALELGSIYQKLQDGQKAVGILQKAVQISPANPTAWLEFAKALNLNKQPEDALKAAAQAAQHGGSESYRALVISGEILLTSGDDKKAMDYARQAEKLAPLQPETRLLICKILAARGKEKDALAEINRAVEELPEVLELNLERARLVNKLHGANAAMLVVQPLAEEHPDNDNVLGIYASVLADTGKLVEAEESALQALRINPTNADIHLLLGRLFTNSGQLDKAVHHLSESAKLSPTKTDAYLDLGAVYTMRRDYPQALDAYQQAMTVNPSDFRPFYQAGLILRDGKDYLAAENMLRRAAALAPQDVNIRRQLGAIVALNLVHNCQEASSCL